jgi:adenine-specific DNA-methyltransferase
MKIIDNVSDLFGDDLKSELTSGRQVRASAANFSIHAFAALAEGLRLLDSFEFIFTGPSFVTDGGGGRTSHREFIIPPVMRPRDLAGTPLEIRLRNRMTARALARECAAWIRDRGRFKANTPIDKTLRPMREESVSFEDSRNLFIEGDNLDALKLLQENYLGKIKIIYIDPPYNTGKDFIYKDNFAQSRKAYETESGQRDEAAGRLVSNPETNGRFHSDWLSMMYPRLKLARNFLRDDGLLLISIDDFEQAQTRRLCDDLFGEGNFVAELVWEKGRKNDARLFSVGHEYMIIFAKDLSVLRGRNELWREEKPGAREIWEEFIRLRGVYASDHRAIEENLAAWFSNLQKGHPSKKWARYKRVDAQGPWRDRDISWPGGDGPRYDVIHPTTKLPCVVPEAGWRFASPEEMQRQIKLGLVEFREDHTKPPFRKAHLRPIADESIDEGEANDGEADEEDDELATQVRPSVIYKQSQVAVKYLRSLMGAKIFTNPKDHEELASLFAYMTANEPRAIIMDFFAGSGTSAEAVFEVNRRLGGKRTFIAVQIAQNLEEMLQTSAGAAKSTPNSRAALRSPYLTAAATIPTGRSHSRPLASDASISWRKPRAARTRKT